MFCLSILGDTVPVDPPDFNKNYLEHLKGILQDKYVDRVSNLFCWFCVGKRILFSDFGRLNSQKRFNLSALPFFKTFLSLTGRYKCRSCRRVLRLRWNQGSQNISRRWQSAFQGRLSTCRLSAVHRRGAAGGREWEWQRWTERYIWYSERERVRMNEYWKDNDLNVIHEQ